VLISWLSSWSFTGQIHHEFGMVLAVDLRVDGTTSERISHKQSNVAEFSLRVPAKSSFDFCIRWAVPTPYRFDDVTTIIMTWNFEHLDYVINNHDRHLFRIVWKNKAIIGNQNIPDLFAVNGITMKLFTTILKHLEEITSCQLNQV
jgi:hypothetical protein